MSTGKHESYWIETSAFPNYEKLQEDTETEVCVVGGGIAGITTAYLLTKKGYKVTLIEALKLGHGTTGYTTAKLTAQHDLIYDQLISKFGEETARIHYEAAMETIDFVRETEKELQADFQLSVEPAYVFTDEEKNVSQIEKEWKAYEKLGIPGALEDEIALPVSVQKAVRMDYQAQFHPLLFLQAMAEYISAHGGRIYEDTRAETIEEGEPATVKLKDGGSVTAKHVVIATHFPFYDFKGAYFARLDVARSYIVAGKSPRDYPGGMYISIDSPSRSVRSARDKNGDTIWLIGGDGHRTGKGTNMKEHYSNLRNWGRSEFDIIDFDYNWSSEDFMSLDQLFYIGRITKRTQNLYVATAFRKWGMSGGITAAKEITSLIEEGKSLYNDIYDPARQDVAKGIGSLAKNMVEVSKGLVSGKLEKTDKSIEEMDRGEAGKIRQNGKLVGIYKDDEGTVHKVDTTCTHMGCEVHWNDAETTWDCPCHGSRFRASGEVIEGPAVKDLKKVD
ncbi:Glycine/D-amino acid oxidase [Terribacillus saccharophilus]|uniref:Glycine/D-amino acid oxidase n=1 Tax=Terribacillus saccharophilus TaxID=361277 RepID=A0AAX2EBX3_9BACI|nr:Glycine/D-amino acid oxidase [Terribacillus saccharophilus]